MTKKLLRIIVVIVLLAGLILLFLSKSAAFFNKNTPDNPDSIEGVSDNDPHDDSPSEIEAIEIDPYGNPSLMSLEDLTDPNALAEMDSDNDGITDLIETQNNLDPYSSDTDNDGLLDFDEINIYGTDPLKADSDGDGIFDGNEIFAGLDPLNPATNGINDNERIFNKAFEYRGATLAIEGDANMLDVYMGVRDLSGFTATPGIYSELFELYNYERGFSSAEISIPYDKNRVKSEKINVDDLKIFWLKENGEFEEVPSTVDKEHGVVTASLEHFSLYCVGNSNTLNSQIKTDVFILLDNSGSMYSKDYNETFEENDVDFKRVDMAKDLISKTDENIRYRIGKFTASFTLLSEFTDDKETLYTALDRIKTESEKFNGTFIATSLVSAIRSFDNNRDSRKIIIILTDGETTEGQGGLFNFSLYDEDDAISRAIKNNISIITIGLGKDINPTYLTKIASQTGGFYVHANDADALERVVQTLLADLQYGFIDTDNDNIVDSQIIADSGFDVTKDGFGFGNYHFYSDACDEMEGGQCFGLATVAQIYYRTGTIPKTGEKIEKYKSGGPILNGKYLASEGYDISNIPFFDSKEKLINLNLFNDVSSLVSKKIADVYERDINDQYHYVFQNHIKNAMESYQGLVSTYKYDYKKIGTDVNGGRFSSVDCLLYDIKHVDYETLSEANKQKYQILKMINYYFTLQGKEDKFNIYDMDTAKYEKDARFTEVSEIFQKLNSGIPLIFYGQAHAVNAIRVYRDIKNPYLYTLVLYDNNVSGKEQQVQIIFRPIKGVKNIDLTSRFNNFAIDMIDVNGTFGDAGKTLGAMKFAEYILE